MADINKKLTQALQPPDYRRLVHLGNDVWDRIDDKGVKAKIDFAIPFGLKASALALVVVAFIALSQVSFTGGGYQADLFDLRYFSYQEIPSVNLAAVNTYKLAP